MNTKIGTASVGYPVTRFGVSFFPVYLAANELPEISTEGLIIDELDSETVSTLSVRNPTEKPILITEGEHLVGGKQNRAVNSTVLVPPSSELETSCSSKMNKRLYQISDEYEGNSSPGMVSS